MTKNSRCHLGVVIDEMRACILEGISLAQKKESDLITQGCIDGHIHFKIKNGQPTNIMFMWKKARDGKRDYMHVGVDEQKQTEARAQVEREKLRQQIRAKREALQRELVELDSQLKLLHVRYGHSAGRSNELVNLAAD